MAKAINNMDDLAIALQPVMKKMVDNMAKEIILTDKNNVTSDGKKFPKTPRPEVVYGGIFPTKEMIIKKVKQWL